MKCKICFSPKNSTVIVKNGTKILMCDECGLVYSSEQPSAKKLTKLYNSGYFSPVNYYIKTKKSDSKVFQFVINRAHNYKEPGKILDIGCSIGTFLDVAAKNKWDVTGIEINRSAVNLCKARHKVKYGHLENRTFKTNFFDAVNMGDVIEHLADPGKTLKTVNRVLKKGGILIISTPDIAKWSARRFQIKPGEHLFYFSKKTIRQLLEINGFEVLEIRNYNLYKNISAFSESSTFKKSAAGRILGLFSLLGDFVIKIPLQEEMLIIARKK